MPTAYKPTSAPLRQLLIDQANADTSRYDPDNWHERYTEHDNPAALTDAWLENSSSYIWRVGVLTRIDNNKADWMHVWIGHERRPGKTEYIGHLHYADGENDDPGRCLMRALELLAMQHPSFEYDRHADDEDDDEAQPTDSLKPITDAPDWATLSPANEAIVKLGYEEVTDMLCETDANNGFLMRGASLAIADTYETKDLERGMLSSIRGVRNAFAQVFAKRR